MDVFPLCTSCVYGRFSRCPLKYYYSGYVSSPSLTSLHVLLSCRQPHADMGMPLGKCIMGYWKKGRCTGHVEIIPLISPFANSTEHSQPCTEDTQCSLIMDFCGDEPYRFWKFLDFFPPADFFFQTKLLEIHACMCYNMYLLYIPK